MPQTLQVSETIASRTVDSEVVRNVGIPSRLPPAERVVSVNARVEITDVDVETGSVVYSGIIRATIYYAPSENEANVVSIRRNFEFTERVSVPGVRPGYEVEIEASIVDIDFYVINDRLLGVEFTIASDIEVSVPETVPLIEERPELRLRRQTFTIRRQLRERNYTRELSAIRRLAEEYPDLRRIISVDSDVQIIDITAGTGSVTVRGVVNNDLFYSSIGGRTEYAAVQFPFRETFEFTGVTPDMTPFVDVTVIESEASRVDDRRVDFDVTARFRILVIREEEITLPTGIITPELFPVRRTILIDRIVAEESTRIAASDQVTIEEGSPDIGRVLSATGRLRGGSLEADPGAGGVTVSGTVDVNIIYVADLPDQPVYFTTTSIPFAYFIDIPGVTSDMEAFVDVNVISTTANKVSDRQINVRVTLDINLVVTEQVRVTVVTGVSETPTPGAPPQEVTPTTDDFFAYTVRSGDTLFLIAQRYGVTINRLVSINNITDPSQLRVGQRLLIPRV